MSEGGSVTIRAILDSSGVTRGLSEINQSVKSFERSAEQGFGAVEDASEAAADSVDDFADSASGAKQPVEKLGAASSDAGTKARKMGDDAKGAGAKAEAMGSQVKKAHESVEKFGNGMKSAGAGLTKGITLPVLAVGTASVAAAIEMDTSLTNVKKTVDGTAEDYERLKQAAIDYSMTNAVSASEIMDMQSLGAQLGFALGELEEFGRVSSGLEISTNMGAEQAATEMAQFANITKMSHEEISNYGSAIVALGNNLATNESDISAMAMRVAGAGHQIGLSVPEILGFSAALTSMGINAEAGGTAISTVMSSIDSTVARSMQDMSNLTEKEADKINGAMKTWADTAKMSVTDFQKEWSTDPASALGKVLSGMEQAVEEGGNMTLMLDELGITSIRQTDMLKRLASNSELVGKAMDISTTAYEENTALQAEVDNRNESLAAKFEMVKNKATAMAEKVGGPVAEALLDVVDKAEPLIDKISSGAQAFADMSDEEQEAVLQAVALSAALGPVLTIFGSGVSKAARFSKGVSNLAKFLDGVGGGGSTAATGLGKAGDAGQKAATGLKASRVAAGALKTALAGIGIGLAVAAIAGLVSEIQSAVKYSDDMAKSTDGLRSAHGKLNGPLGDTAGAFAGATDGAKGYTDAVADLQDRLEEAAEKQAELADSMAEIYEGAGRDIDSLEHYYDVIDRLAGRSDLTAQEQAELAEAVRGVNEMTGEAFELAKGGDGSYKLLKDGAEAAKDEVLKLIEAQMLQVRYDANKSALAEMAESEQDNAQLIIDAYEQLQEAQKKFDEWEPAKGDRSLGDTGDQTKDALEDKLREARDRYDAAKESGDAYADTLRHIQDENTLLASAMEKGAESIEGVVANNSLLTTAFDESKYTILDFASSLSDAGVNADEFTQKLGEEQMLQLADTYDGTFASIAGILESYGVSWDDAAAQSIAGAEQVRVSAEEMAASTEVMGGGVQAALAQAGQSVPEFASALAEAGQSVQTLEGLTADQLSSIASHFDGSVGSIVGAVNAMAGTTAEQMAELAPQLGDNADAAVKAYNDAIMAGEGPAQTAGETVAKGADGGFRTVKGEAAGGFLSQGWATGISAKIPLLTAAAVNAANAANSAFNSTLQIHSPSRVGIKSGGFYIEGIAKGVVGSIGLLKSASSAAAGSMSDAFAKNLAGIADSVSDVFASAVSDSVAAAASDGYHRVATGAVYRSMTKIINAGYKDLDDFVDAGEKFAEKAADYKKKQAEYKKEAKEYLAEEKEWEQKLAKEKKEKGKVSSSTKKSYNSWKSRYDDWKEERAEWQEEYKEWKSDYKAYKALKKGLEADEETMREWMPVYNVKKELNDSLDDAISWSTSFGTLATKTGVAFSKNFVERIMAGGDDAQAALEKMRNMSAAEIQDMVDGYDDLARAERQQEIAARALYVNSMKNLDMKDPRDKMLDFEEICLDVKEALYSDEGLSRCFDELGVSVEEFALGLQAAGYDMDDFVKGVADFSDAVADGFNEMNRRSQTGLDQWRHNMQDNITEAEHWTANIEKVFPWLSGEAGEAFKKAVLEGGYEVWGQVMAELANTDPFEAQSAADLYWKARNTGTATGTRAFQAGTKTGTTAMEGVSAGVEEGAPAVSDSVSTAMDTAKTSAEEKAKTYTSVGASIVKSIASGVSANAGLIKSAVMSATSSSSSSSSSIGSSLSGIAGSIGGAFAGSSGGAKAASIDWYATGGIFDKAQIIGVGEAGPEAVVPLSGPNMAPFAEAVAKGIGKDGPGVSVTMNNYNNIRDVASADRLARKQGLYVERAARKKGLLHA